MNMQQSALEPGEVREANEVEKAAGLGRASECVAAVGGDKGRRTPVDEHLVTWDSPDDPQSPFNWRLRTKWMVTLFVSFGGFISMMSGSMMAPALPAISSDLAMTEEDATLALSIFILAFAVGPVVLAPFAEVYGRRPVWVTAGLFYAVWNVVCGFSQNRGTLIASRFLSGIGGAVDFVITSPVVKDVWPADQRGYAFSIVYFVPLLGPALGPLVGGAITQHIGWRWLFWLPALVNTALVALCGLFFPETSGARILDLKAKRLTRETGKIHYTEADLDKDGTKQVGARKSMLDRLKMSIGRPTRLFLTQPILPFIAVPTAYNFGLVYYTLSMYSSIYTDIYGQSTTASGVHYIAIALGYLAANFGANPVMDWLWQWFKARAGGATAPEYRVPLTLPSGILMPVGLIWYGWSAQNRLSWVLTDAGALVFGLGFIVHTNATAAYIMDSFDARFAASAFAAWQSFRMLAGFVFPLFAPAMIARLGWGWANTILGLVGILLGVGTPAMLWVWGAKMRAKGKPQW